jgi:hypothetical protein
LFFDLDGTKGSVDEIVAMSKNPGTATLNPHSVDFKLALIILKGAKIPFKFKGKFAGEGDGFPKILPTQSVLEMSKLILGSKHVRFKKIMWTKICENRSWAWKDGYDRLFSVYGIYASRIKYANL